jgi:hypothetical protein
MKDGGRSLNYLSRAFVTGGAFPRVCGNLGLYSCHPNSGTREMGDATLPLVPTRSGRASDGGAGEM